MMYAHLSFRSGVVGNVGAVSEELAVLAVPQGGGTMREGDKGAPNERCSLFAYSNEGSISTFGTKKKQTLLWW
jgi:hypothetical protein